MKKKKNRLILKKSISLISEKLERRISELEYLKLNSIYKILIQLFSRYARVDLDCCEYIKYGELKEILDEKNLVNSSMERIKKDLESEYKKRCEFKICPLCDSPLGDV